MSEFNSKILFNSIIEGDVYSDIKGGLYKILNKGFDMEGALTISCFNLFSEKVLFVPMRMFIEELDHKKFPDAFQNHYFEKVEEKDFITFISSIRKDKKNNIIEDNTIYFAKCSNTAIIPTRRRGDSGFDIYVDQSILNIEIAPHSTEMLPTGIKSIIPEGYGMEIKERGSSGSKGIKASSGIIDSSYRGEWFLAVTNTNDVPLVICSDTGEDRIELYDWIDRIYYPKSKALFQACVYSTHNELNVKECNSEFIDTNKTERGDGALGSSGK